MGNWIDVEIGDWVECVNLNDPDAEYQGYQIGGVYQVTSNIYESLLQTSHSSYGAQIDRDCFVKADSPFIHEFKKRLNAHESTT